VQATVANADTVDRATYHARLLEARAALTQARAARTADRDPIVARARELLRRTTAVRVDAGGVASVDDSGLADHLTTGDASLDATIAALDRLSAVADAAPVDLRDADARLRRLIGEGRGQDVQGSALDLISRALARWLAGLGGSAPDQRIVIVVVGGLGLAVLLFVIGVLGRDLRERFRREVALSLAPSAHDADPLVHLRRADEALRAGSLRDAIHFLYVYAIATLAARELIRYDPSLTDREILARSRTIPHADALRDLVSLHDLVWYGLRDAHSEDAMRAKTLAGRAVA
jgi:hypothetical protein